MSTPQQAPPELDVRELPKPQKHPAIFSTFAALGVGEAFVLVNNHDPRHLRQEFDRDQPGSFGWDYLERGPRVWRIRISRRARTAVPRLVCNAFEAAAAEAVGGAAWRLAAEPRQLDSNVIGLPAGGRIDRHTGPDLDVLMLVLSGSGTVSTEVGDLAVTAGALVWLPRRSERAIEAGSAGMSYLTVHPRRPALSITTSS
jgi:uncharacterized protein (DUF2249 family)